MPGFFLHELYIIVADDSKHWYNGGKVMNRSIVMHKIINTYMNNLAEEAFLSNKLTESQLFERFANYCCIRSVYPEDFTIESITSEEADSGIDGICFIIDGEIAATSNEASVLLSRPKRNIPVEIYFIQAKTSDSYDRGEILKFTNGVRDFISDCPALPQGEFIKQQKEIFDMVISNVAKVQNGRPIAHLRYVCTSNNDVQTEIEATRVSEQKAIFDTGFFSNVDFEYIGLERLIALWDLTRNSITAIIPTSGFIAYPEMQGVSEAYLAIVPAKAFVREVLMSKDGKMRMHIFEENVRAYLGGKNTVNSQIQKTIEEGDKRDKFGIYNNGITIISPDVKIQGKNISFENYQVVNGCQTSNVLFENYDKLTDDSSITIKVIEATDSDVIADIVRATNSQSQVSETQFLSFTSLVRRLERYFEATEDQPGTETKLFFERRNGQYKDHDIPKRRVFSITETCRAVGAMFMQRPDLAYRYPTKMINDLYEKLLSEKNKEIVYYSSAVALYRLKLLLSNGVIDNKYSIYKWHILMILPFVVNGKVFPSIQNKKVEPYCQRMISICSQPDEMCLKAFNEATRVLDDIGLKNSRDEIRSLTYTQTILEYCHRKYH